MRRIADLAKMSVLGAFFGTLITIPVVYFFREKGIVPSLIAVAAMTILTSWWYSRKIEAATPVMSASQVGEEATGLLKLGFAFMASGLMTMGSAYAVRIIVLHTVGFEATGLYQSAWMLGGLYVGFILQAMGADFYPRLTAGVNDHVLSNRIVNEQAHVGLLIAGPGALATLTFAPVIISLFYSAKFGGAVEVLRWICLGTALQVITWPMGFIVLAKGKQNIFLVTDLAWTIVYIGLAWICVKSMGLNGAGAAFFGSYVFHAFITYPIAHRLTGFRWSLENRRTGVFFLALIAIVFGGFHVLPFLGAAALGTVAVVLSGSYSARVLSQSIRENERAIPRALLSLRPVSLRRRVRGLTHPGAVTGS